MIVVCFSIIYELWRVRSFDFARNPFTPMIHMKLITWGISGRVAPHLFMNHIICATYLISSIGVPHRTSVDDELEVATKWKHDTCTWYQQSVSSFECCLRAARTTTALTFHTGYSTPIPLRVDLQLRVKWREGGNRLTAHTYLLTIIIYIIKGPHSIFIIQTPYR